MATLENLKYKLIQRIKNTENTKLLLEIEEFLDSEDLKKEDTVQFSHEQEELLNWGEEDLKNGRVISQEELDNSDAEWIS